VNRSRLQSRRSSSQHSDPGGYYCLSDSGIDSQIASPVARRGGGQAGDATPALPTWTTGAGTHLNVPGRSWPAPSPSASDAEADAGADASPDADADADADADDGDGSPKVDETNVDPDCFTSFDVVAIDETADSEVDDAVRYEDDAVSVTSNASQFRCHFVSYA